MIKGIIYEGYRDNDGKPVVNRTEIEDADIAGMPAIISEPQILDPTPSQALYNHSPDVFEWGYSGSGPAQLALALLLDATGDKVLALKHHQEFKERFVSGWRYYWCINAEEIREWVARQKESERINVRN